MKHIFRDFTGLMVPAKPVSKNGRLMRQPYASRISDGNTQATIW